MPKRWTPGDDVTAAKLNETGNGLAVVAQDTPDLTVRITEGTVNIGGIIVKYTGGSSAAFTVPSSNPRIDLVTIDSSGVIGIVAGVAAASPSAPNYPIDKLVLAEIRCVAGMTKIVNTSTLAGSTQGYVSWDARPVGIPVLKSPFFGDGSDGNCVLDGTNTYGFLTKSGSVYTLTRDTYFNNLTINATLVTDGWKIFVADTVDGTGTLKWGTPNTGGAGSASASGGAGGAQSGTGPLKNVPGAAGGGTSGVGSGPGAIGGAGQSSNPCIGSDGATGGPGGRANVGGSYIGGAGGPGGTKTLPNTLFPTVRFLVSLMLDLTSSLTFAKLIAQAGAGGGGGGGDQGSTSLAGSGGGAGASGGMILLIAYRIAGTFTIEAKGADGGPGGAANASTANGGGGGGAGGNGGIAVVVYAVKLWTGSYLLTGGLGAVGGAGDSGGLAGSTGSNGNAGTYYEVNTLHLY